MALRECLIRLVECFEDLDPKVDAVPRQIWPP
jgi:hypothetical protein